MLLITFIIIFFIINFLGFIIIMLLYFNEKHKFIVEDILYLAYKLAIENSQLKQKLYGKQNKKRKI